MHMPTMMSIHEHPESAIATLFPIIVIHSKTVVDHMPIMGIYGPSVGYCFIEYTQTCTDPS
jgi:hypothetical protein